MLPTERKKESERTQITVRKIRVEISDDAYDAYLTVDDPDTQPSEAQAALEAEGVVYGLDNDAVVESLSNLGKPILVASGSRHNDGVDGWFERVKPHEETEAEKRFGIINVNAGDAIGVIHKPTPGSVGVDVCGRKVQPKHGQPISFLTGPNIKRIENDDQTTLEALVDGCLTLTHSGGNINKEYVIHEDVDYSDGELEFAGSLKVVGDIKGSSRLKVRHDVLIGGSVEDAKIIAGGNVTIKGSFVGRGDGLIRAGGDVEGHVVLNQMIEAGDSITIRKEAVNSRLMASNSILASHAVIMGGTITAGEKIEVHTLGGELYSTTRVRLGLREILNEDLNALDKEIQLQTKYADDLKNEIYLLVRDRIDGKDFTTEKANQLKLSQAKLQEINDSVKQLNARKQETVVVMNRRRSPKLTVLGTIHQSVVVEISGVRFALRQSYSNVTFEEVKNEIVRTKNF